MCDFLVISSVKEKLQAMLNLDRDFTEEDFDKVLTASGTHK